MQNGFKIIQDLKNITIFSIAAIFQKESPSLNEKRQLKTKSTTRNYMKRKKNIKLEWFYYEILRKKHEISL